MSIKILLNSLNFGQNPTWIKAITFKPRARIGVAPLDHSGLHITCDDIIRLYWQRYCQRQFEKLNRFEMLQILLFLEVHYCGIFWGSVGGGLGVLNLLVCQGHY